MATWHQQKGHSLSALYRAEHTTWKVVNDPPNAPASAMTFNDEASAHLYARNTGGVVIAPESNPNRGQDQ